MSSVLVYNDVIFPDHIISMGVVGKNSRVNERVPNQGGYTMVDIVRGTLREITFGYVPLAPKDWSTIEGLHEVTAGGAYGMLMHDPKDYVVRAGEGLLQAYTGGVYAGTVGVGYGVPTLRMFQRKTAAGTTRTFDRRITRPQAPSALMRGGVAVPLGAAAGNASINYDTGTVTFVADASQSVSAITPGATTSVTLAGALSGVTFGGRLYLQGLTGADAALLNGKSHAVTNKVGNVYTLGTDTAGKSITVGAGQGVQYPQPSETLTWTGLFYIPIQFRDDSIDWEIVRGGPTDTRLISGPSVVLIEIPEQ